MAKCLDCLIVWLLVVTDFTDFPSAGGFGDSSNLIGLVNAQTCASQNEGQDCKILDRLPCADGYLHLYALPVGQGSAIVLHCPNGDIAINDLGSGEDERNGFWSTTKIKTFFQGHYNKIKNIVITHSDKDHYSLFEKVFTTSNDLPELMNIYISCTFDAMPDTLRTWITKIGARNKVQTFNEGRRCGHSKTETCKSITLCPGDPNIETRVLSANAANCEKPTKKNVDSIVIGITFNNFTMQLNGDFEDCSENEQNGPQKQMVAVYGDELKSTVYMLSHHGADRCANKPVMLDAVKPKAVFASSNPFREGFRHPRCNITDYLIDKGYLCKPIANNGCGQHPMGNVNPGDTLQQTFTCGLDAPKGTTDEYLLRRTVSNNPFAIYSTTPSKSEMNLVHLVTNGTTWGFINDIQPRIKR